MLDTRHIGTVLSRHSAEVEAGRLRFFAKATGQTDARYTDKAAATAAGYPALPVPPTFLFCLEMEAPNPRATIDLLGIDIGSILHGEQSFQYHRMAFAGERLHFEVRIADIYEKKGGALGFVVRETRVTDGDGGAVADLRSVIVVRGKARESK
ncbi:MULTISPECIES: MaoC family dehydratase N-terminal domain-containing protein [unclassified Cupriavidus]|uniref:MaoC family dehydratase N-terminal domain-containing protein n=1 Tax=unclassified Cupriavidus TaxID=2640874 RepID=UPI0010F834C9|nr:MULTISPECIES: MaoC family dehydratase N-terminal domain-containing protein [unclassified Cupriavidus]MWL89507.1 MaoC family dehydratase [Cupriavidus sp. SW-Y-13]